MAYLKLEYYRHAHDDFVRALTVAHGLVEAVLLRGKTHFLKGEKEEAEKIFSESHKKASAEEKNEAALWIAGVYYSLKDYAKGLEWTDQLGEEVPMPADSELGCANPPACQ